MSGEYIRRISDEKLKLLLQAKGIENASDNLLELKKKVGAAKTNGLSFLMVLTGTEHAFQMKNGVWVVPLGCLKD